MSGCGALPWEDNSVASRVYSSAWIAVVFSLAFAAPIVAQEHAEAGWSTSHSLTALRRPLGVSVTSRLTYTQPIFVDRSGLLWDSARVEASINNQFSPAFDDISMELMVEPVAFFDLTVRGGIRYAFEGLGFGFAGLADENVDYEDTADLEYRSLLGRFVILTPRLKAQLGPVIAVSSFQMAFFDFPRADSRYFYEPTYDIALGIRDLLWQSSNLLLYEIPVRVPRTLRAGVNYTILRVSDSGEQTQRISMLGLGEVSIGRSPWRLSTAFVFGLYVDHRYYDPVPDDLFVAGQVGVARSL